MKLGTEPERCTSERGRFESGGGAALQECPNRVVSLLAASGRDEEIAELVVIGWDEGIGIQGGVRGETSEAVEPEQQEPLDDAVSLSRASERADKDTSPLLSR